MEREPQHPVNGAYPVIAAVNDMTGVWEEFCLRETPGFDEWSEQMRRIGWRLHETTLEEVLKRIVGASDLPLN